MLLHALDLAPHLCGQDNKHSRKQMQITSHTVINLSSMGMQGLPHFVMLGSRDLTTLPV